MCPAATHWFGSLGLSWVALYHMPWYPMNSERNPPARSAELVSMKALTPKAALFTSLTIFCMGSVLNRMVSAGTEESGGEGIGWNGATEVMMATGLTRAVIRAQSLEVSW